MIEVNKIAIPFGRDGNKNTIYDTRQQGQAENDATWSTGFPPITMQDKTDGGLPPKGLDFNGIFYDISSNVVFSCMGGQYQFDAEYAEKIGGYPKGAILMNNALDKQYISNTDKNKINFNSADSASLTAWSIISIKDIDKLLAGKIDNADFSTALNLKADARTQVIAGNGITGGGTLQSNRTLTLGTPSKIEETSKNAVTASSHTHEIAKASTSTMGITKLSSVISDAEDVAATPKSVNAAKNRADSAYSLANSKQDKLEFVGSGKVMREGAYGLGTDIPVMATESTRSGLFLNSTDKNIGKVPPKTFILRFGGTADRFVGLKEGAGELVYSSYGSVGIRTAYDDKNTTTDKSGFIRASGNKETFTKDLVTQSTGSSTTNVMSQKAVTDRLNSIESSHGLGYGQSWVDVTSQRVANTTYTNNTGKPIQIHIHANLNDRKGGLEVNGVILEFDVYGGVTEESAQFVIPAGSSYKLKAEGIFQWVELRS